MVAALKFSALSSHPSVDPWSAFGVPQAQQRWRLRKLCSMTSCTLAQTMGAAPLQVPPRQTSEEPQEEPHTPAAYCSARELGKRLLTRGITALNVYTPETTPPTPAPSVARLSLRNGAMVQPAAVVCFLEVSWRGKEQRGHREGEGEPPEPREGGW